MTLLSRLGIIEPLRNRHFRRFALGSLVSMFGDGLFKVAIAALVFAAGGTIFDLSKVAAVWGIAMVVALPVGGWAGDRFRRKRVLIWADLVRAVGLGVMGGLSMTGSLRIWQIIALGAVVGGANGFFNPTAVSYVPDLLRKDKLDRANAFLGFARPTMLWILGPLAGSLAVRAGGPGFAMILDAATFLFSAVMIAALPSTEVAQAGARGVMQGIRDVAEGFSYVRRYRWFLPLVAGGFGSFAYYGLFDVLVPGLFREDFGMDEAQLAAALAWIFIGGGLGSILVSLTIGQRGLPRRFMTALYLAEALGVLAAVGYGVMNRQWNAFFVGFAVHACFTFAEITWTTSIQRFVPRRMLGRVSSFDWMLQISLIPLGALMAGALGTAFGPRPVLVAIPIIAAAAVVGLMFLPGARAPEQPGYVPPEPDPEEPPPGATAPLGEGLGANLVGGGFEWVGEVPRLPQDTPER